MDPNKTFLQETGSAYVQPTTLVILGGKEGYHTVCRWACCIFMYRSSQTDPPGICHSVSDPSVKGLIEGAENLVSKSHYPSQESPRYP